MRVMAVRETTTISIVRHSRQPRDTPASANRALLLLIIPAPRRWCRPLESDESISEEAEI
jgi:hypothetical protein